MPLAPAARSRLTLAALVAAALSSAACGGSKSDPLPPPVDACVPALTGTAPGYQCFGPGSFSGDQLTVTFPALGADEQVAVLLVNPSGDDNTNPAVTVSGVGPAPLRVVEAGGVGPAAGGEIVAGGAARSSRAASEAMHRALEARLASLPDEPVTLAPAAVPAPPPAVVGEQRQFCYFQTGAAGQVARRVAATLRHLTPLAQFWVADEVWPAFEAEVTPAGLPAFWATVGGAYDGPVNTTLNAYFGPQTDVDGNGQMMFLFANLLLGSASGGIPVGLFNPGDFRAADPTCTGSASNRADILYLMDPGTWVGLGGDLASIVSTEYPATMAHELQHNVNYNARCRLPGRVCGSAEVASEKWINEGLAMLSEDLAGFGLAHADTTGAEFERVGSYYRLYRDFSLTSWETGDAFGNYGGVHAFMRYWMDQKGGSSTFTRSLLDPARFGTANVAAATGVPFEAALLRFSLASLFSGEAFSPIPAFDFDPAANWSPLHLKLFFRVGNAPRPAYVRYTPLPIPAGTANPVLRKDGWGAYLAQGNGGTATVTVSTPAVRKPHVLLVRFTGDLPR